LVKTNDFIFLTAKAAEICLLEWRKER